MRIEVFHDTVCPWCRIGEQHLFTALERWDGEPVELVWRAFQLDPGTPEGGLPYRETLEAKFGGAGRMDQMFSQVSAAGQAAGLDFRFDRIEVMPNTLLSHRLIAVAPEEKQTELLIAVNRAHFSEGRDTGQLEVLLDVASSVGLDAAKLREQLDRGEGAEQVQEDLDFGRQVGITGVPFYIMNGKYALTGAQPPETFLQVLKQIQDEAVEEK
ncbi:DsbA family oxidoreductase [Paenibacillus sp. GD4]|uniref:DsbA family oxidoreductase n=1 Tax=Paenibacillus sp. GD4 TaxID=3068890 RepID=UPI002796C5F7|nr:DsbA family oxidoreductase [Paenibacillus sp. GD4]MDQ1911056.1 DsbA family oxidoreductase [Paenibacillus sp. GD4]